MNIENSLNIKIFNGNNSVNNNLANNIMYNSIIVNESIDNQNMSNSNLNDLEENGIFKDDCKKFESLIEDLLKDINYQEKGVLFELLCKIRDI